MSVQLNLLSIPYKQCRKACTWYVTDAELHRVATETLDIPGTAFISEPIAGYYKWMKGLKPKLEELSQLPWIYLLFDRRRTQADIGLGFLDTDEVTTLLRDLIFTIDKWQGDYDSKDFIEDIGFLKLLTGASKHDLAILGWVA